MQARTRNLISFLALGSGVVGVYSLTMYKLANNPLGDKEAMNQMLERKRAREAEAEAVSKESLAQVEQK